MELKNEKSNSPQKPSLKRKWLITAGGGLSLFSAGLCVFSEAAFAKHDGAEFSIWFGLGFLALLLINAGISIFGNAVTQKSYMDSRKRLAKRGNNQKRRNYNKPRNKGPRNKPKEADTTA